MFLNLRVLLINNNNIPQTDLFVVRIWYSYTLYTIQRNSIYIVTKVNLVIFQVYRYILGIYV